MNKTKLLKLAQKVTLYLAVIIVGALLCYSFVSVVSRWTHQNVASFGYLLVSAFAISFLLLFLVRLRWIAGGRKYCCASSISLCGPTVVVVLVVAGLTFFAIKIVRDAGKFIIAESLTTVVESSRQALIGWSEDVEDLVESVSHDPKIRAVLTNMPQNAEIQNAETTALAEDQSQTLTEMLRITRIFPSVDAAMIVESSGRVLYSDNSRYDDLNLSKILDETAFYLFAKDSVTFIPPTLVFDKTIGTKKIGDKNDRSRILIGAPIMDDSGTRIGALVLALDPTLEFTQILERGRVLETGETYAIDRSGTLISGSRFEDELVEIGLIEEGWTSVNNISVADPGQRLRAGAVQIHDPSQAVPTTMVKSATAKKTGLNLAGYRDYRGELVVGAWTWDDHLDIGIATEIDVSEAYGWIDQATVVVLFLGVFACFCTIYLADCASLMHKRMRHAKSQAEDANHAKSDFLANMSHEIRTPLNGILGFTEVMLRGSYTDEKKADFLSSIHTSGRHLLKLIDDILDLSKIEAGKIDFDFRTCSPHAIIRETLSVLRVSAMEKGLELECEWQRGLPETITTDPARLRQLLFNIVMNAIKFTETGGVKIQASIEQDVVDPHLVIEVIDSGIGIHADHLERIFSPFDQADNSVTRKFGGTGLGLAISSSIAEGLGGDISVQSVVGIGSTFRIRIATGSLDGVVIAAAAQTEAIAESAEGDLDPSASISTLPLENAKILVCEDGESNRELINLVLVEAGAKVVCAENGQIGVDIVAEHGSEFDAILMDMQMPILDGYSAARQLRDKGWKKPIIALTAHAMRGDDSKCLDSGCCGYLTKPINIDDLLSTVADAIDTERQFESRTAVTQEQTLTQVETESVDDLPIESTLPTERPAIQTIVDKFVTKLNEQIGVMQTAIDDSDFSTLAELAHWLKGAGGTIGFDCFTAPAKELEAYAKADDIEGAQMKLKEIGGLCNRIALPWKVPVPENQVFATS